MHANNHNPAAPDIRNLTNRQRIRAILGACSGNLVEWYDFFIYAYTSIYFAALFFPSGRSDHTAFGNGRHFCCGLLHAPPGRVDFRLPR